MLKNGRLKKGATLMELTIVLAVLAIIATMVATFSVFFNQRTKATVKANDLMQDVVSIKAVMEAWASDMSKKDNVEFTCENDNIVLSASANDNDYSISLSNGVLSAELTNTTITSGLVVVNKLEFSFLNNQSPTQPQKLFICKAFYTLEAQEQYISFTINPFVGDLVA